MRSSTSVSLALMLSVSIGGSVHAEGIAAWIASVGRLLSSAKVSAKQIEVSKSHKDQVAVQAGQANTSAAIDMYNRRMVAQVLADYGPSSQLVDPCYQVGMANMTTATVGSTSASALASMQRIYQTDSQGQRNVGGVSGIFGKTASATSMPYAASVATRMDRHMSRYCTVSEAQAGLCSLNANGMQGADSDFSVLAVPGKTWGWDQTEAATDFIKTVAPVKAMPKASDCKDASCLSELSARRQQEAYLSMARYSMMRFSEAHSTQASSAAKGGL